MNPVTTPLPAAKTRPNEWVQRISQAYARHASITPKFTAEGCRIKVADPTSAPLRTIQPSPPFLRLAGRRGHLAREEETRKSHLSPRVYRSAGRRGPTTPYRFPPTVPV